MSDGARLEARFLPAKFGVVTLFPDMFSAISGWGVTGKAFEQGLCELSLHNPRNHAIDRHGTVDDRPYGGGPGMVMQAPILNAALAEAKAAVISGAGNTADVGVMEGLVEGTVEGAVDFSGSVVQNAMASADEVLEGSVKVIALTPQGRVFNDQLARTLAAEVTRGRALVFVAGRYEGFDERFFGDVC